MVLLPKQADKWYKELTIQDQAQTKKEAGRKEGTCQTLKSTSLTKEIVEVTMVSTLEATSEGLLPENTNT